MGDYVGEYHRGYSGDTSRLDKGSYGACFESKVLSLDTQHKPSPYIPQKPYLQSLNHYNQK